jgi:hypothetical protein
LEEEEEEEEEDVGIKIGCCSVDHCWLLDKNNNEIHQTRKAGFDKIDDSCLDPWCAYSSPEDTSYVVLFRVTVCTNRRNLTKIVSGVVEKIVNWFVYYRGAETYDGHSLQY